MLHAAPGTNRRTCSVELESAVNLGAAALLNVITSIFGQSDTAETQPEPEPDPDPQAVIRIKWWGPREREQTTGIWVTREQLEEMRAMDLLTDAIVTGPYYDLASQPFGVEGRI